jgi:DNA-binding transcriptional MerR regulator
MSSTEFLTLARQVGLPAEVIQYCYEVGLVEHPTNDPDLVELRRIRRLQQLELNLPGIEVILRMRRRMIAMQQQMEAMRAEMSDLQQRLEREVQQVRRQFAQDV